MHKSKISTATLLLLLQLVAVSHAQLGNLLNGLIGGLFGDGTGYQGYVTTQFGQVVTVTSATQAYSTIAPAPSDSAVYCSYTSTTGDTRSSNRGLEYAYYYGVPTPNNVQVSNGTNGYPSYDPTYWDTQIPVFVGQTTYIGFATTQDTTGTYKYYPDSPGHSVINTTLIHRGYLYARTTGNYAFINAYIDDIVLTWTGPPAAAGYTRQNAELVDTYTRPPQTARGFSVYLTAGQYLAFRVQYTNAEEAAGLQYYIFNPAGQTLLSQTVSVDIVAQPCNNSQASPSQTFSPVYVGSYTTVTSTQLAATATTRSTVRPASSGAPGEIRLVVPAVRPTVTITSINTNLAASNTLTSTLATATGTDPITVEVVLPVSYTTITGINSNPAITAPITNTLALPVGTAPGTIQILTPASYVTITNLNTNLNAIGTQTTTLAQPTGTIPGTVELLTPPIFTTITQVYTNGGTLLQPLTTVLAFPTGTVPGTVEVIINGVYSTATLPYTGAAPISGPLTTTAVPAVGTTPGSVIVYTPTTTTTSRPSVLPTTLGRDTCVCVPV